MNTQHSSHQLARLKSGVVYRRRDLLRYSKSIDRDLKVLVQEKKLCKASTGIYYKPIKSRFGVLPPDDKKLVRAFLSDDKFLLFSRHAYNELGLGLTQLYNQVIVYNHKRHGQFTLAGKVFDFRRPHKGFPKLLMKEFLLVDLVNHLDELSEDVEAVKTRIRKQLPFFEKRRLKSLANQYGKLATTRFFLEQGL